MRTLEHQTSIRLIARRFRARVLMSAAPPFCRRRLRLKLLPQQFRSECGTGVAVDQPPFFEAPGQEGVDVDGNAMDVATLGTQKTAATLERKQPFGVCLLEIIRIDDDLLQAPPLLGIIPGDSDRDFIVR